MEKIRGITREEWAQLQRDKVKPKVHVEHVERTRDTQVEVQRLNDAEPYFVGGVHKFTPAELIADSEFTLEQLRRMAAHDARVKRDFGGDPIRAEVARLNAEAAEEEAAKQAKHERGAAKEALDHELKDIPPLQLAKWLRAISRRALAQVIVMSEDLNEPSTVRLKALNSILATGWMRAPTEAPTLMVVSQGTVKPLDLQSQSELLHGIRGFLEHHDDEGDVIDVESRAVPHVARNGSKLQ